MANNRAIPYRGILFCGPGKSGKDTAAQYLSSITQVGYGGSTSDIIASHIAEEDGITVEQAMLNRYNERPRWREKGDELRAHDPGYLASAALMKGPMISGVRGLVEIEAVIEEVLVNHIVWVVRDVPPDSTLDYDLATLEKLILESPNTPELHVVFNKGEIEHFRLRLLTLAAGIEMLNTDQFKKVQKREIDQSMRMLVEKGYIKRSRSRE